MNLSTEDVARVCHAANRELQLITGDASPSPEWSVAPSDQRESATSGVRSAVAGESPRELHDSWCAGKRKQGWRYGFVKSADRKTHPCLVPYEDLPPEQQLKDALFHAIVRAMTAGV